MIECLLPNNTSNCFKFIMTLTRGKNLWSLSQKWNDDSSYFQEIKDCRQHALIAYAK